MARNILKTLKDEHDELRDLFDQLNDTSDRAVKKRAELLAKIKTGLLPHAKWEEVVFYPLFKERADRDGLQTHAEAVAEHKAVEETIIPAVDESDFGTPEFAGRTKVFGEMIDHHATEEENTMFKMAKKMFTPQELSSLDEQYEDWKASPECKAVLAEA